MLEEKNDNLPEADGQEQIAQEEIVQKATSEDQTQPESPKEEIVEEETQAEAPKEETLEEETIQPAHHEAIEAIQSSNAEESEDEGISEGHDIPMLNYEAMSMEELTDELNKLVSNEKLMSIRNHVEEIKKDFMVKYHHLIDEKRDEYSHENNGDTSGFEYHFPLKHKFDSIYNQYKDQKNQHFKQMQNNLKYNLDVRTAIIEELKNLIDNSGDSMQEILKSVNDLRERWKNAGPIPRDKYNHVWNNFHFHIERFYDHLHLDREARDLDFKHNYDLKLKIIARVEELVNEEDVPKAFRELQSLHKIWKEEIGPVSREHREELWNRFSELTKQLHDKREVLLSKAREYEVENLARKKEIIAQIEAVANEKITMHSAWQGQIEKIEALRTAFMQAGKVPIEVNEETWAAFKDAVRNFNAQKNAFYKDIKKDQQENLNKKLALVERAKSLQESEDFNATTPIMKQIQEEWKQIGHVPRKYSDSVWKDFKDACNHYFDRMHEKRNEANGEEVEAFEKKKEYLETLKEFQLIGEHKTDLDAIKNHIETWKSFGKVPHARRHIEGKFNKILDALFDKLSLSKKDAEMAKFSNRLGQLADGDERQLQNEQIFIMRKIDEMQSDIIQLENNIQFITSGKSAKADNPFVKEVQKSIDRHKEELKTWKEKLKQIRSLKQ
jgi:uncharacterized protein DUF349